MGYYSRKELENMGFKKLGKKVMVSTLAQIYKPELIELGDQVRIDDFCILSNNIKIGSYVHIAARTLVDGGIAGITFEDYTGAAYNCIVIASSDSYKLESCFGPCCLPEYRKKVVNKEVVVGKYSILGSFSLVLPGTQIAEGCSFGAYSLIMGTTEAWNFYNGQPIIKIRENDKGIIEMARLNTIALMERDNKA